jgi:hypothetical protein
VECITNDFAINRKPLDILQDMAANHYIKCINHACQKNIVFGKTKLDRNIVSALTTVIQSEIHKHVIIEKEREFEQRVERLRQEQLEQMRSALSGGNNNGNAALEANVREREVVEVFKMFMAILSPLTPCCGIAFEYNRGQNEECDAITCTNCNHKFCALCLKREACHRIQDIQPHAICPVHAHVQRCPENEHFRGSYFSKPFYAEYRMHLRFETAWNSWLADEEDEELVAMLLMRLRPILEDTNVKFTMDGGTTKEILGKDFVVVQLPENHREILDENRRREIERRDREEARRQRDEERRRQRLERRRNEPPRRRRCGHCREEGHNRVNCPVLREERRLQNEVIVVPVEEPVVGEAVGEVIGAGVGEAVGAGVGEVVEPAPEPPVEVIEPVVIVEEPVIGEDLEPFVPHDNNNRIYHDIPYEDLVEIRNILRDDVIDLRND